MRLLMILLILITSCAPASKDAMVRTQKNLVDNSKNDEEQSKQIKLLTDILVAKGDLPPEVANPLKENAELLVKQSEQIVQKCIAETQIDAGIFSMTSFMQATITVGSVAKPFISILSSSMGLPPGAGEGITAAIMGLLTAWMSKRNSANQEAQRQAHAEQMRKEKEARDAEMKRLKDEHDARVAKLKEDIEIAGMQDPKERENYLEIKKKVKGRI